MSNKKLFLRRNLALATNYLIAATNHRQPIHNFKMKIIKAYFLECMLFQSDQPIHWLLGIGQWIIIIRLMLF
jgi:hypothetical protein